MLAAGWLFVAVAVPQALLSAVGVGGRPGQGVGLALGERAGLGHRSSVGRGVSHFDGRDRHTTDDQSRRM
jgi:hypothetical protein